MTLVELLDAIGDYSNELIQICDKDTWDNYDTFHLYSPLLKPFYNLKVISIGAIKEDVFRVDLDFSEMEGDK